MNGLRNVSTRLPVNGQFTSIVRPTQSRTIVQSQLLRQTQRSHLSFTSPSSRAPLLRIEPLRSQFLPEGIHTSYGAAPSRGFFGSARSREEKKTEATKEAAKDTPKEEAAEGEPTKKASEETSDTAGEGKEKTEGEEGEGKKEGEKKEAPPPPPPHGDKSPWQVFTETLQTEFKASKEWNESTKALAGGVQQFTENESVRKAREAYQSTTGAVSSTTGKVLKSTAGAVGKGAAWTWDTPVVKGVRTTVNATATVIEKGTRPLRETEAYKNVKNVIDDGSSSRYGGWVEKEERRRIREQREEEEAKKLGLNGKRVEVMQEDPE